MKLTASLLTLFGLVIAAVPASAQINQLREPQPAGGAVGSDQPLRPQPPTLVPRVRQVPGEQPPAQPQPPKPPFTLTPQEEAQVDRVLNLWEERNRAIQTFDCQFKRWIYDSVFGPANQAKFIETGVIKYAAPDKGLFRVEHTERDGKVVPIEDSRVQHWVSDGKSIFELNPAKKQVIEHKLPPELQGKAIADSPLPFLFGADAKKLKQRYFLRIVTPQDAKDQIWLEAYPRFQQDAANFHHAQLVIKTEGMTPFGLMLVEPTGKDRTTYQFYDIVVNDPLRIFRGDPFRPFTPLGWQKVVDEPPSRPQQARARPTAGSDSLWCRRLACEQRVCIQEAEYRDTTRRLTYVDCARGVSFSCGLPRASRPITHHQPPMRRPRNGRLGPIAPQNSRFRRPSS